MGGGGERFAARNHLAGGIFAAKRRKRLKKEGGRAATIVGGKAWAGLKKGDVKRPDTANLVLGMAYFNLKKYDSALKAFNNL